MFQTPPMQIQTSITPFLLVANAAEAVLFYEAAFGAVQRERHELPGNKLIAKLAVDNSEFWVADEEPDYGNFAPAKFGGSPVRMILVTAAPELVFEAALQKGAQPLCAVRVEHSWKIGRLLDPSGHLWEIGHPLP